MWDPLFISATVEASNFKFGIQVGIGSSLRKQLLGPKLTGSGLGSIQKQFGTPRPKLAGVRASGAFKKVGTPYLFLQPLKLATSNLVHNLGLGSSLPRNNFYDENWYTSSLGERPV